ncbi:hypothetical protein J5N97_005471 [Dioscorea zingiberensis]|uniref:Pentatricopeptide repeat-containing protein n=1 Tax=Dioscorea zingiberensis TaxID=325984 RepID=A0A9D5DAJ2_9LILI|nr:hypothetical protein J5N97_005471 [Dioscorea zingiberensis]
MRDRTKNRKPVQRGRYLSVEAIQAVQALKRGWRMGDRESLEMTMAARVRRLVKRDMMAVLGELQSQGEALLALQVFEEVRKEHWYKPRLSVYVNMIIVLASNGLYKEVDQICSYLKKEHWEADIEGFNSLLKTLLEFDFTQTAMDCFRLMKLWESEPDDLTYRILIQGLESKGEMDLSVAVREEAEEHFGRSLDFLDEKEETASANECRPL